MGSLLRFAQTVEKLRKGGLHWVVEGDVFNAGNAAARLLESWLITHVFHCFQGNICENKFLAAGKQRNLQRQKDLYCGWGAKNIQKVDFCVHCFYYSIWQAGLRDEVSALGYETSGGPDDQGVANWKSPNFNFNFSSQKWHPQNYWRKKRWIL